jgi:hypothetical protein
MASNLNSNTISEITEKEKELTGSDRPVKGGPTAQAQKHAGETISSAAVGDITQGERKITGEDGPIQGGPAAAAQSHLAGVCADISLSTTLVNLITERRQPEPTHRQARLQHNLKHHPGRKRAHRPSRPRQRRPNGPSPEARRRAHQLRQPSRHH